MKKEEKTYNTSKVELRLYNIVGEYYQVEYRFVDIKIDYKFLFFKWTKKHQKSKWREAIIYHSPISISLSDIGNPDDNTNWWCVFYRADDFKGLECFKDMKSRIKTYEDLDREFGISESWKQYEKDLEVYNQLLEKSRKLLKSIENNE